MQPSLTIIGSGNMAYAILKGVVGKYSVEVVARDASRLDQLRQEFGDQITTELLGEGFEITDKNLLLCVKPHALQSVAKMFRGEANALLSVLAGVKLETLKSVIKARYTVRIMPNLAARFGKSMTTLCGDEAFRKEAIDICNCFGSALWVGSEKEIDIATAIAGSGPAYLALIAEALADGGVHEGLKREDAVTLVRGLFDGFAPLLNEVHPALLKDAVMSPGGTTAAGYAALEKGSVRDSCIKAVGAAYQRAVALGKK
jgi:pyrroline-5-carboxylate reductase